MGIRQIDSGRKRNRQPHDLLANLEPRMGIEQRRNLGPPAREIAARAGREHRVLRHADLVGAGEIFDVTGDRPDIGQRGLRPQCHRHQHHIGAFIDVVHQPADRQPLGHRIERIARAPALRQVERQPHPLPRIAGVRPVAVPFACLGREAQRQHLRALRRRGIDEQFGRDILVAIERLALCRLTMSRARQHQTCDDRKPECSEVSDRMREGSCVRHALPSRLAAQSSQSEPPR